MVEWGLCVLCLAMIRVWPGGSKKESGAGFHEQGQSVGPNYNGEVRGVVYDKRWKGIPSVLRG